MWLSYGILVLFFFVMIRRPPRSTRTATLFPYTTLFRSVLDLEIVAGATAKANGVPSVQEFDIACRDQRHAYVRHAIRSEEHTSELQSLMRISYAVFCLKKKKQYIEPLAAVQATSIPVDRHSSHNAFTHLLTTALHQ